MARGAVVLAAAWCASLAVAGTPDATEQFTRLQAELRSAHAAGKSADYLEVSRRFSIFLNGSPDSLLQIMSAASLAGQTDAALEAFRQFVHMGLSNEQTLSAQSFAALHRAPEFASLYVAMTENDSAISQADLAFKPGPPGLLPEDIDYDARTRRFYISTVLGKQVLALDLTGHATVFAESPDKWPMLALKVDSRRRLLWATEVALNGFASVPAADWGKSTVLIYDLGSGKLLHRVEGPPNSALSDMTLDRGGDAFISDGDQGGIYRVSAASQRIERVDGGDFISPQTPAVLPDGRHLLVPDYVRGLGALDLATKRVTWIPMEGAHALSGIDGLYLAGAAAIATQNGVSPERVVRFELNNARTRVISESTIERRTTTLGDPTHGVIVGRHFYYIANSGWDVVDEHGNLRPGKQWPEAIVMRAGL